MRVLLVAFFVCALSCHSIHEGKVIDKEFIPAHTYYYTTFIHCGKVMIPISHKGYAPDRFVLYIEGYVKKDTVQERFSVTKAEFDCEEIGHWFNDSIPCEIYRDK